MAKALNSECITLDLPGAGQRVQERAPLSIDNTADAIAEALQGETAPVGVLALSLGGMVALSLAARYPNRVARLVLINSSSSISPAYRRMRPSGLAQILHAAAEPDAVLREMVIYRLTTNTTPETAAEHALRAAQAQPMPLPGVVRQLFAATRFSPPRPQLPCLVLSSKLDKLVNPRCSEDLARYLACPHYQHPTGGHDLPAEDPDWILSQLKLWLEESESPVGLHSSSSLSQCSSASL